MTRISSASLLRAHLLGTKFIGRTDIILDIFQLLRVSHSILVIGRPRIGKTSLLKHIETADIRNQYLKGDAEKYIFSYVNSHLITSDMGPADFWALALKPVLDRLKHAGEQAQVLHDRLQQQLKQRIYDAIWIGDFLRDLAQFGLSCVVLVDECDFLLSNSNMSSLDFWAPLRALCTTKHGILLVASSTRSAAAMTERIRPTNYLGSPLLNHFVELTLDPFSQQEASELLHYYIQQAELELTVEQTNFLSHLSGRLPFLIQSVMNIAIRSGFRKSNWNKEEFRYEAGKATADYCAMIWNSLDDPSRALARAIVTHFSSTSPEIQPFDSIGPALRMPNTLLVHALHELDRAAVLTRIHDDKVSEFAIKHGDQPYNLGADIILNWIATTQKSIETETNEICANARLPKLSILTHICKLQHDKGNRTCPISTSNLRELISKILPDQSTFDAFCIDYFPHIRAKFANGMDRTQMVNNIFHRESVDDILVALYQFDSVQVHAHAALLLRHRG